MALTSIKQLSESMNKWATTETQKMQGDLYSSIKAETPVDTGRAQAGWIDKEIDTLGDTGLINNDVDYIGWLEFGTTRTGGHFMVTRNIKRVVS